MIDQDSKSTIRSITTEAKKPIHFKENRPEQAIKRSTNSTTSKTISKVQIVDQILLKIQVSVQC